MAKQIAVKEIAKSKGKNKGKKSPNWWKRLPLDEQMEYLEEHPRSKLKPSIKKTKKLPKDIDSVIDKQTPEIVDDLNQAIDKAEKAWPDVVANMDPKEVKEIESQITAALKEEADEVAEPKKKRSRDDDDDGYDAWGNSKSRRIATGVLLATKIGLLTVGAGALLMVNPSYVFLMPMLAKKVWDAIPDGSIQTGMMLYMGHRMMKGMRDSLKSVKNDTDQLKKAVVDAQPTTVASPAKKATETGHYSHYTDIIKSLGKIEQEKVQLAAEHISYQTNPINKLAASLFLLYKVEDMVPNLANLYMTCSSQENLSLKPRILKNLFDFKAIRQKLKEDVATLALLIDPTGMVKFGNKMFDTIRSQFRGVRISHSKTAIFNAAEKNKLQVVHCYSFDTPRGSMALYVHADRVAYSIERSKEFTPTTLIDSSVSAMLSDLKSHLAEVM